jgi:hypothetical protein
MVNAFGKRNSIQEGLAESFLHMRPLRVRRRVKPALKGYGPTDQERVQSYRYQSAGDNQALEFGRKQTKRNVDLGGDKRKLPNLRETGSNNESSAERVAGRCERCVDCGWD